MRNPTKHLFVAAAAICLLAGGCSDTPRQPADNTPPPSPEAAGEATVSPQPAGVRSPQPAFQSLSPQAAYDLIRHTKDLVIVDVRTPQEIQKEGMIEGSINLPFWAVLRGRHNLPKERPLLVVCAVGGRSFAAGQALARRQGYPRVYNLAGGISAWKKAGLPVVHDR